MPKVGRNLAPQLKALAPIWFLCQVDPHPPAASVAQKSFSDAFPSVAKRREAVVNFCLKEILAMIEDNLLTQTPETLSDAK